MQHFSLALLGLVASMTAADNLPVPRNMCGGATDQNGKVLDPITYGPAICVASGKAAGQAPTPTVAFTDNDCVPAFCHDGTALDLCKASGKTPGAVAWSDISDIINKSFNACGGISKDGDKWIDPNGGANNVKMQSFQYVGDGYLLTMRGQDCDQGDYKAATFKHC